MPDRRTTWFGILAILVLLTFAVYTVSLPKPRTLADYGTGDLAGLETAVNRMAAAFEQDRADRDGGEHATAQALTSMADRMGDLTSAVNQLRASIEAEERAAAERERNRFPR